jgi:hypothetical protein
MVTILNFAAADHRENKDKRSFEWPSSKRQFSYNNNACKNQSERRRYFRIWSEFSHYSFDKGVSFFEQMMLGKVLQDASKQSGAC